jgi:hypothetical protein
VKRSLVAALLGCALLLPGCGIVKSTAEKLFGAGVASIFGNAEEDAAKPAGKPQQGLSIAADENAVDAVAEEDAGDAGGSGFYKIVEPSGTVRFTSNLSEVPVDQRPQAERLAMAPSKPSAPRNAPAARRETAS